MSAPLLMGKYSSVSEENQIAKKDFLMSCTLLFCIRIDD
jgi:hypothetical protein